MEAIIEDTQQTNDYEYILPIDKVPPWKQTLQTMRMYEKFPQLKLINRLPQYQALLQDEDVSQRFLHNSLFNDIICLWRGDMLRLQVDAIVNSAHHHLGGGGGSMYIDGKVQWKAGEGLINLLKGKVCGVGQSLVTPGFELPSKYIIHTVASREPDTTVLESCYRSALEKIVEFNFRTVGFCCVGTGHYENPPVAAARVALSTIREWLELDNNHTKVDKIIFSVFSARDECIYEALMPCYFPDASSSVIDLL